MQYICGSCHELCGIIIMQIEGFDSTVLSECCESSEILDASGSLLSLTSDDVTDWEKPRREKDKDRKKEEKEDDDDDDWDVEEEDEDEDEDEED